MLDEKRLVKVSKYLSKHLRHQPERLGLELRAGGWVTVSELLEACARSGFTVTEDELREVVERSDKQRFGFDPSGLLIRANQGHSVTVDLELEPVAPPPLLFHGTGAGSVGSILSSGLKPMARHHVHLSIDEETARRVGMRHGRPVILTVDAARMAADGFVFFVSTNGVWLTDAVPPEYLRSG